MKLKILIPLLTVILIFSLYKISKARSFQFFGKIYSSVKTDKKAIALTFDDGPTNKTDTILALLNKYNVKATFFLVGSDIKNYSKETKAIIKQGHDIGNHSYSHQRMILKTPDFIKSEIEKTDSLIQEIGYKGEIYFRPPNGKKLLYLPYYLKKHDRITVMWDIEPESYTNVVRNEQEMVNFTINNTKIGSIILLHLMHNDTKPKLKALEKIIIELQRKGFEFKTISELIKLEKN